MAAASETRTGAAEVDRTAAKEENEENAERAAQ